MAKHKLYDIPDYCKIIVEGRINSNQPWGLRNALRDEMQCCWILTER